MHELWPSCGYRALQTDAQGWLVPGDDFLRGFLARPELAPVAESCDSERALHALLLDTPGAPVKPERLARLKDEDARESYALFLRFRDALLAAGTVEAYYLQLFRSGPVNIPPLFVDLLAQLILRHVLDGRGDAVEARAAEMLFRPQRITLRDGRVLAADQETLDRRQETSGLGELGRMLMQAQVPLKALQAPVLTPENAEKYWAADARHPFLLDLTHAITRDLGHGIQFKLTQADSGLHALARVLERWVAHLLGVQVTLQPVPRIADENWRWHVGLDAEASSLLNDLYEDRPVEDERMARLLSLFKLSFADPAEMRPDVAGRPVYLGMAMNADGLLRLKPQNLLTNLPLHRLS